MISESAGAMFLLASDARVKGPRRFKRESGKSVRDMQQVQSLPDFRAERGYDC
jgi:hypothetical protein